VILWMDLIQVTSRNLDASTEIDYDLHGIVGIRVLQASPEDIGTVSRQLGPIQTAFEREADIIIRFVDELPISSPMHFLGLYDVGYTNDAFLVLRSKHKTPARVQIPFEKIGQQTEIICERGLSAVPHLISIINLTALGKGFIPLHASAFNYRGIGVLVTGWAKGGKTEMLLAFMTQGAEYIGDEWVYLDADGQQMYGIPEPIRLWDWHLTHLPEYRAQLKEKDRLRLSGLRLLVGAMESALGSRFGQELALANLLRRVQPLLKNQMYVHLAPEKLFGQDGQPRVGRPELIFFVANHEHPDIQVCSVDPMEVARRMVFSLQEERMDFMSAYMKFRFAFPRARNEFIERAEVVQRELIEKAFAGKRAYAVYHPYPVGISRLFEAVKPLI
jgi:hypothetical protein